MESIHIDENIKNITLKMGELDTEIKRLSGMLQLLNTLKQMGHTEISVKEEVKEISEAEA